MQARKLNCCIFTSRKKISKKGKFSSPFFSLISLTSATTMEKKEENKGIWGDEKKIYEGLWNPNIIKRK